MTNRVSLRERSSELEIMDDLDCKGEVVDQTLRELEVINRLLGGDHVTIGGVDNLLSRHDGVAEVRIGDLGCGGGDLAMKIVRYFRKQGVKVRVEGVDANPNIIEFARKNCSAYPEITLHALDVFGAGFRQREYDVLTATLFVHHFNEDQLVDLFAAMHRQSRIGFVIKDIHRHPLAYYSIKWLTALFSKSPMVKFDAPLSVRRAFKREELEAMLRRAGITDFILRWKWAFRWQVIVRRAI